MKRFLSLLLSLLLCTFILPLSGCNSNTPSVTLPKDTSKKLDLSPQELNVDWDKAIAETPDMELDGDNYYRRGITDMQIHVNNGSITFDLVLDPERPEYYMDSLCCLMRALNEAAMLQDKRIPLYGEFSLGGIYDIFETTVIAYTPGNERVPENWYINDVLAPGEHRKRLPEPLDGSPAVPALTLCKQLENIFNPEHDPKLKDFTAQMHRDVHLMEGITDEPALSFILSLSPENAKEEDIFPYTDAFLRTVSRLSVQWDSTLKGDNGDYYGEFLEYWAVAFLSGIKNSSYAAHSLPNEPFVLEKVIDENA